MLIFRNVSCFYPAKLQAEDNAHKETSLSPKAYNLFKILERFRPELEFKGEDTEGRYDSGAQKTANPLQQAALEIDTLYTSAPRLWQNKTETKKKLKRDVKRIIKALDLEGWQRTIPTEIETYAIREYPKQ